MITTAHLYVVPRHKKSTGLERAFYPTGYEPSDGMNASYEAGRHQPDGTVIVVVENGDPDLRLLSRPWTSCTLVDVLPDEISRQDRQTIMSCLHQDTQMRAVSTKKPRRPEPEPEPEPEPTSTFEPTVRLIELIDAHLHEVVSSRTSTENGTVITTTVVDAALLARRLIHLGVVVRDPNSSES